MTFVEHGPLAGIGGSLLILLAGAIVRSIAISRAGPGNIPTWLDEFAWTIALSCWVMVIGLHVFVVGVRFPIIIVEMIAEGAVTWRVAYLCQRDGRPKDNL